MLPVSRMNRTEKLLGGLDIASTRGLEIGALDCPLLSPAEADIRFVDHVDQASLRSKYANDPAVDEERIVPVHGVWGENTLAACFPGELFDYVIASHVIEHVPDVVGWLEEIAAVLRPGGRLILAIPDRRYTYDLLRRETRLSELVDNYLRRVRRPTPGQVFDFSAGSVDHDHRVAWSPQPDTPKPTHFVDAPYALIRAVEARDGAYIDSHCSVFTARSLLELLDGLLELGLIRFQLERFHVAPVGSAEMSLILRLQPSGGGGAEAARAAFRAMLQSGMDSEGLPLDTQTPSGIAHAVAEASSASQLVLELAALRASTSWKITAPLRIAGRWLASFTRGSVSW